MQTVAPDLVLLPPYLPVLIPRIKSNRDGVTSVRGAVSGDRTGQQTRPGLDRLRACRLDC